VAFFLWRANSQKIEQTMRSYDLCREFFWCQAKATGWSIMAWTIMIPNGRTILKVSGRKDNQ
jgi:hypothetical protein